MRRKRERFKSLALFAALGLLLTGCGSSKGYSEAAADTAAAAPEYAYDSGAGYISDDIYSNESVSATAEEADYEEGGSGEAPAVKNNSRKLIKNVNLEVETETFDDLMGAVRDKTERLGGYIEESYTYNGSSYYGVNNRNANLTIRIPADKLDEFLSAVAEVSNIISRNESVTDVTLQYVDMESHKKVLLTEQERLIELLGRAETIEDIISLESRLSEVRYQIESMEAQLRTLDNQVSYSTVYLYIDEVKKLTPVKEQSAWEKISTGFMSSLYDVGNGLVNFGINLIIDLPYLLVWGAAIALTVLILRWLIRRRRKKAGKEDDKKKEKKRLFFRRRKNPEEGEEEKADNVDGK